MRTLRSSESPGWGRAELQSRKGWQVTPNDMKNLLEPFGKDERFAEHS